MAKSTSVFNVVGMELEATTVHPILISRKIDTSTWRQDSDASVQTPGTIFGNMSFIGNIPEQLNANRYAERTIFGTELVLNPPFSLEGDGESVLLEKLLRLTDTLQGEGEPSRSTRAGLHIHISCPMSLGIVKALLMAGRAYEDVFFLLGTNGYQFRGELVNESSYCRPITGCGPTYMPSCNSSSVYGPIFDVENLLQTKTMKEFWWAFGNVQPERDTEHMHPARYFWLNLYSLLAHGTVENRTYNVTLNPYLIHAQILFFSKFIKHFSVMGLTNDHIPEMPINSVFDRRSRKDVLLSFVELANMIGADETTVDVLYSMLKNAPMVNIKEKMIKSHILETSRGRGRTMSFDHLPKSLLVSEDELSSVTIMDIHTLRGEHR